jgi:hypothetical protein
MKGLLFATMEPPAGLEDEFNDWYDTEHFPQRVACPGFERCARFVCVSGWPRYGAVYDLSSTAVLDGASYKAIARTPWTSRIFPRLLGFQRVVATQVSPGDALTPTPAEITRLLVGRYPNGRADALAKAAETSGAAQPRVFANQDAASELWLVASFNRPVAADALMGSLGSIGGAGANLFNLYVPYRRG